MRDLALIGFLVALLGMGLRRPFLFVLAYVYIDIVSPQRLTYFLLNAVPISLIAVALAVAGWAVADDKRDVRFAPRQLLIVTLLLYCLCTTFSADFPIDAWDKWSWVWKALAFAAFLPLTLRTRLRIEALLLFMILSASSIMIVGGIKTLASGGGYGELNLMVANNSGLYEGSTASTVAIAIIPLILWFTRHGTVFAPDWRVRTFAFALTFACLLIPIGTSTRTGLLCIGLLAALSLRSTKRKLLYLGGVAAVALAAIPFLPSAFTDRMHTIKTYQADTSASTRLAVWQWTIGYAKLHPFGGGFEAYRGNHIRYDTVEVTGSGANTALKSNVEVDQARAYHSAYFEMLGEQGYPGLALWLFISVAGIVRMELLRRRYREPREGQEWIAPLATALQHAHLVYMLGAAFIAIAFQPFIYMLIGAQIGLDTYLARLRAAESFRPIRRPPRDAGGRDVTGELRALTGARGIAAWLVVLYHVRLSIAGLPPRLTAALGKGYLAVDFFFLLSGFVIALTWRDRLRSGGWRAAGRFWWKRVARVWPLHLVMLALALALALAFVATGRPAPGFPFAELPLHILLLQNWGFTTATSWNVPAWSISAEAGAYLLFPPLALAIDWRRAPTLALLAGMAGLFLLLQVATKQAGLTTLGQDIAHFGLPRCLVEFAAGVAVHALWERWRAEPRPKALAAVAVAVASLAAAATGGLPETLAVPPAFAAMLLALALSTGAPRHPLETRVAHYLGEVSYATYLSHYLLFIAFKLLLVHDPRAVPPALIAFYLALVLAASVALHQLVERPAQTWLTRFAPRLRPARA